MEKRNAPPMRQTYRKQSGLAIITVLLIIALMVTLLGFLIEQQHLLVRRITNQNVSEQGFQYAAGIDAWAARVLHDDVDRAVDYWGEDWARFGDPAEIDDGEKDESLSFNLDLTSQQEKAALPEIDFGIDSIEYQIEDMQGRFNLNNLANAEPQFLLGQKRLFLNLLDILEIGEFDTRPALYGALADWLDSNDLSNQSGGVESLDYQVKATPYYAADQKLTTLGELRFIEGFTAEVINALAPHVTILPVENARININTTSTEVLASLSAIPVIDTSSVETFLAQRLDKAFLGFQADQIQSAGSAIIATSPSNGSFIKQMMQTSSQFFRINTRVTLGDFIYCAQTTVLREVVDPSAGSAGSVIILNRTHNPLCDEIIR